MARLVDEAAVALAAREWHGNRQDSEWFLARIQRFLSEPVLVPRREARHAMTKAERAASASDAGDAAREDRRAWDYLLLMKDLDEHDALLEVLADRLQQLREVRASPFPHTDAACAYPASLGLVEDVLGDGYLGWWVRHIDPDPTTVEHARDFRRR